MQNIVFEQIAHVVRGFSHARVFGGVLPGGSHKRDIIVQHCRAIRVVRYVSRPFYTILQSYYCDVRRVIIIRRDVRADGRICVSRSRDTL